MQKRGISSVVATVLIILITVAAVSLVWVVVLPMIKQNLSFEESSDLSIVSSEGYTAYDKVNNKTCVQVRRGPDNSSVIGVNIILDFAGNSVSSVVAPAPETNRVKVYCFNVSGYSSLDSIQIAPIYGAAGIKPRTGVISSKLENIPGSTNLGVNNFLIIGVDQIKNPTCIESWSCGDWGVCSAQSLQTKNCTDANKCGTIINKPVSSRGCRCVPSCLIGTCGSDGCGGSCECSEGQYCDGGDLTCKANPVYSCLGNFDCSSIVEESACSTNSLCQINYLDGYCNNGNCLTYNSCVGGQNFACGGQGDWVMRGCYDNGTCSTLASDEQACTAAGCWYSSGSCYAHSDSCGYVYNQQECEGYFGCSWNPGADSFCKDVSSGQELTCGQTDCEASKNCGSTWTGTFDSCSNKGNCTDLADENSCNSYSGCYWGTS